MLTDDEIDALLAQTQTEGYPSDVRRLVHAVQVAERERLRVMLTAHLDQTVMSHHVTLAECHAARNALQLVLDEWALTLPISGRTLAAGPLDRPVGWMVKNERTDDDQRSDRDDADGFDA